MNHNSDSQLIAEYLRGDEESLRVLIRQYLKPIYSFAVRYVGSVQDAEDITQEVFIKIWRNIRKFDLQRSFKTWIFSIAKNTCIDWLKKKKPLPFSFLDDRRREGAFAETLADPALLPSKLIERRDAAQVLSAALKKLLPKHRMLLFLRYNDHFTFREIAESLEEPLHTVKSRHRRSLALLRKLLAGS